MEPAIYIKEVRIENIRAIDHFEMTFPENAAGWHVLIGDNGSGKSSIIRSISLGLIGPEEAIGLRPNWNDWLKHDQDFGNVKLTYRIETELLKSDWWTKLQFTSRWSQPFNKLRVLLEASHPDSNMKLYEATKSFNLFSSGFGPFRRFTGGSKEYESVYSNPELMRLSSHLSLFGEDVALTEATTWLVQLRHRSLEKKLSDNAINLIKSFINSPDFLPNGVQLTEISSDGVFFKDGNGATIQVNQMSDGFRSILSLTFELIRQMVLRFGYDAVFKHIAGGEMFIGIGGVVLIDEVDAHLHPTWQTRIGQWFLKYFPNIQFIVTTHSPLICRAAEKGSIWRLATPGSGQTSGEVTGIDRNRLIYGNILDAYGTEVFGQNVEISEEANGKLNELAELNIKSIMGEISPAEESKMQELKTILPTETLSNDPASFR